MIPDIKELNFPKIDGKQYATLTHATANIADMGEKTITTQVKIDGNIVPDFSFDWAVEFQGEKYIMPLRIPQGAKGNTMLKSQIDLTFQHWAIYQLKRWPFVTIQQIAAGTYLPDEEVATVQLNLGDFCILFGQVLEYYYGGAITMDFNDDPVTGWQYKQEATRIEISHTKIWNVLIDAFHDKYGVRWEIVPASDNSNTIKGGERYVIRVGYPTTEVDHIFEYGFEGGLLKVERQVQSDEIRNMLKGRGGETNIPFRYFKNTDPNNPDFRPDPDWVEELANIYFPNLMGATFRSYVQGWKAAHISKYPGYTAVGENNAYAPWAYRKGYTDTKFAPVEFVADEITIEPQEGDKQVEILPGYSPFVKKGSSLDKYGPLPDTLDNNEDIYPTLQGTGLDIAVDVEQIESDDVAESTESDAQVRTLPAEKSEVVTIAKTERKNIVLRSRNFYVDTNKTANLDEGTKNIKLKIGKKEFKWFGDGKWGPHVKTFQVEVKNGNVTIENASLVVVDVSTGQERSASGIPGGTYYFRLSLTIYNTANDTYNATVECPEPKLTTATLNGSWKNTFDIWVKNVWDTQKGIAEDGTAIYGETDSQYSERVWKPVLGDREKNTAKVVFTSGALVHEDYEFTIVGFPGYDTSKAYEGAQSHWRITLAKSDAELEATGLYVPSTKKQGKAGDTFVFIGTEMTHEPYVVDAEIRLDNGKKDKLGEVKEIKPTAVVTTDRVRLNNERKPNALINQLRTGNSVRLFDKRFFNEEGKAYETLYLQSITYTYREPTSDDAALNPDVEIVLGEEYMTSANPVSMMQGEISALQKQVGSISNIDQIVRTVGDRLYLRKDGISDRSLSPTQFFSLLTSGDFRAGLVGGAGWGFFKDENGNWVLEADRVNVRQEMQVNTLVINQAEGRGGMEIDTAAFIDGVSRVVETDAGYVCYFDQKDGSVANLFHVDDVAFCNRWTPENAQMKFYKRRVTAVGTDNITLSKTDANGAGTPEEGDNIIHFGNYTDKERQYVKVRDVVGGGYEQYIEELNSVDSDGIEYYFIGKQAGQSRWFIGNKDLVPYSGDGKGSYIEYINRKFNLNNVSLSVSTTVGDKTLEEYIQQVSPPVKQEDIEQFVENIVNPKIEGIQDQIDGVIETWFFNGVPTLANYPANGWNTEALKIQHLGDLYYNNDTGTAYRFSKDAEGVYYWNVITDDAITKALAAAHQAQDTADNKRRVFTSQPTPPYDKGDLWVNATYPAGNTKRDTANGKYYNDILRCGTSRDTGIFTISDWGLSSNYTDDTKANEALERIAGLDYLKNALLPENPTQITGGLIMSTLISLGYTDANNVRHTMAGMNGAWVDSLGGRTIGSWFGGDMLDLEDYYDWNSDTMQWELKQGVSVEGLRIATGIDRMDGTGYRANGNLWWDNNGKVYANPLSFFVGENSIGNVSALFAFNPTNNAPWENVVSAYNVKPISRLRIGSIDASNKHWIDIEYDADNDAIHIKGNIYADGEVSAGGKRDGTGSGGLIQEVFGYADIGGAFSDSELTNTFNAYTINQIAARVSALESNPSGISSLTVNLGTVAHQGVGTTDVVVNLPAYPTSLPASDVYDWAKSATKPNYEFSEIISKPTTLSGYGITDAYTKTQADGRYVNLTGAQTITGIKTITAGLKVSGRAFGGGDDEGIVVGRASNNYAALTLGVPNGTRSVFYLLPDDRAVWRYNNGSNTEIVHPAKSGTIALTSDLSAYVKKSGDDMTGQLSVQKGVMLTYSGDTGYIQLGDTTNKKGRITGWAAIQMASLDIFCANNELTTNGNKLWHFGNDGSGSGLDADLLDGYHGNDYLRSFWTNSPGYDCDTYANQPFVTFTYGNHAPFTGPVAHLTADSYGFYLGTSCQYDGPLYYRRHGSITDGTMGAWQQLARITDNVASATKATYIKDNNGAEFYVGTAGETGIGPSFTGLLNWTYGDKPIYFYTNSSRKMIITGDGMVGIGVPNPKYNLDVAGNIHATSNIKAEGEVSAGAVSDRRLKDDITTILQEDAMCVLLSLNPVEFRWNGIAERLSSGERRGIARSFIADEFLAILPNAGRKIWKEYDGIYVEQTIPYLVKGWQLHETRLQRLERENKELKLEINKLKSIGYVAI